MIQRRATSRAQDVASPAKTAFHTVSLGRGGGQVVLQKYCPTGEDLHTPHPQGHKRGCLRRRPAPGYARRAAAQACHFQRTTDNRMLKPQAAVMFHAVARHAQKEHPNRDGGSVRTMTARSRRLVQYRWWIDVRHAFYPILNSSYKNVLEPSRH